MIKIFTGSTSGIETIVNAWIDSQGSSINIRNITYSANQYWHSVMIWYDVIQPPLEVKE